MEWASKSRRFGTFFIGLLAFGLAEAREEPPTAIVGVRAVPAPGELLEEATIVLVDGRITALGSDVPVPEGARVVDGSGLWAYAGFIDAASHLGIKAESPSSEEMARLLDEEQEVREGPRTAMQKANRNGVWPHLSPRDLYESSEEKVAAHRKAGFTTALLTPHPAILGGSGDIVQLSGRPLRSSVLASGSTQIVSFRPPRSDANRRLYPSSIMGGVAMLRQVYLDAEWYRERRALYALHPNELRRPEADPVLEAMQRLLKGEQAWIFVAATASEIHHALDLAQELDQRLAIVGGREAWRVVDRLREEGVGVIVSPGWDKRPEIDPPSVPDQTGSRTVTATWSRDWEKEVFEPRALREEREREWRLEVANLATLHEAGVAVAVTSRDLDSISELPKKLQVAVEEGLAPAALLASLTTGPAAILGLESQLGTLEAGKIANLTLLTAAIEDPETHVAHVFIDGERFSFDVRSKASEDKDEDENKNDDKKSSQKRKRKDKDSPADSSASPAHDWEFETLADRLRPLETGGDLLLRNGRLLTMAGPILDRTDVSVIDGRIYEIGRGLVAADGQAEIDVGGLWVMPGIVDAHSHLAVTGINEGSQSISAEVRQADVVNHRQLGIHRALAGGVTTIHTMHGSANSIGGQNAVLKLKYETSPAEMLVETGPRIVKFALGENVTRSRTPARFPNTRMGVESVMRQAFVAAQQYQEERDLYTRAAGAGLVVELPRRDLRLEALSEILGGDIWVHSHCYRADEILRLLAVAEDFGFRIATLQHVLEGYRVLPEMVHHGVGGSTFSDWWSYKVEARQAIPYNAAMMAGAGIVTSINSDSAELIRHLNLEASKTLRFGGLDADQALRLITLNPAIQIGLDERIGSLEKGKDGDLAVFRGHPLDTHALNVMTVVEGEIYFAHKELDLDRRTTGVEESAPIDETEIPTPPRLPLEIETSPEALYAIRGATLHPVSSPPIERGTLVLREGRIEVLGGEVAPPPGAIVVEADGLHVYPGLINAASQLSLFEISGLEQTRDHAELARFQPDLRTTSAIDPFSEHVAVARAEGITTAAVLPTGGIVSGRGSLVQLDGWSMPEMLREGEIGLVVSLPSLPARLPAEDRAKAIDRLAAAWEEIERYFDRAVHFSEAQPGVLPRDLGHEAMTPYLRAEKKVLFRANSYKDILQAVRFAEHYGLRAVILGGGEAWKVAEELARKEIPVIVTTVFTRPTGPFERFDDFYANAGRLEAAGVEFCIAREGREDNLDTKLLPIQAGMAVAHGLSAERAVRAITIDAARILGVGSQIGSLEPGKVADVIITTGDPTKATTRTVASFIAGVPMDLGSLHEENYKKWSARPVPDLDPVGELRGPPPMRGGD